MKPRPTRVLDHLPRRVDDSSSPAVTASDKPAAACGSLSLASRSWLLVRSAVLTLAATLGVICFVVFGVSLAFGVQPLVVISGSMEPTIPTGSVVFTRVVPGSELVVGDIVTVERPRVGGLVTHRVVASTPAGGVYELTLKGDANSNPDAVVYAVSEAGRYVWHVPHLGNVALLLQSTGGALLAAAAGTLLIAVYLLDPRAGKTRQRARRVSDPAG